MSPYERPTERKGRRDSYSKRPSKDGFRKKDARGKRPFGDRDRRPRDFNKFGRDRPEPVMTKVICSSCGEECEVPFKPTSSKPVYCRDCYSKDKGTAKPSKDFDIINEKLNKIMAALKIK